MGLAVPENQIERTILDCLIEDRDGRVAKISEIVWQIASDFDLAPANIRLAAFEQMFAGRPGREERLLKAIEPIRASYQWCIIDCPPSVGLLAFNALRACDEAVVPVETGFFSLQGLTSQLETLEMIRERLHKDIRIRILPTLYDTRTKLAREVLQELRSRFSEHLMHCTINFNTKLKEAASFGQPITEYDPGSRGYKDFANLARELMGQRPLDAEPGALQQMSRPAELVQRARQLAQLSSAQFGRSTFPTAGPRPAAQSAAAVDANDSPTDASTLDPMPIRRSVVTPRDFEVSEEKARAIDARIESFYGVKQIGRELLFQVRIEDAKQVSIAGDFNGWAADATPMQHGRRAGEWRCSLPLKPGRYRYRLVVDGKWMTDPNNQFVEVNQFGELNNVVDVEENPGMSSAA